MATIEELRADEKRLEAELKKVKTSIKRFDQNQEREKVRLVRKYMDELGVTYEQLKPKQRKPRKAKTPPAPTQAA